jgi:hypothetical protein
LLNLQGYLIPETLNIDTQMKTTFLAIVIALFGTLPFEAQAQHAFPLPELQKLCMQNANDFETFMLTNDYSLQSKLSNATTKVYWSDKKSPEGKQFAVTRSQVPNAVANLQFINTDKKWYLELKKQLAATGYKFVKEENKTINGAQATSSNFTNGKYQISVFSYTTDAAHFGAQIHL